MACKDCERRRAQMKEWLKQKAEQAAKWARVRNAKQAADSQSKTAQAAGRGKAPAKAGRSAGKAVPQHEQRSMEGDTPSGAER